jgi:uncharacterized protein involved in outer membrane biogenesis
MAGRRVLRWGLRGGAGLLVLLALVLLSLPLWLPPILERQAAAALGREVTVGGLRLRPGSPLVLTARDVTIANPPGFPAGEPFARIPRLTVHLDALAWLRGEGLVLPLVELDRPALRAITTGDGRSNHAFRVAPAGEGAAPAPGPRIGVLRIREGSARVILAPLDADVALTLATVEEPGQEPMIRAEAEGSYAGQPILARLRAGGLLGLRDPANPWPVKLHLANGPTRATVRGTLQDPLNLRGAEVALLLEGPDMALLAPLTGVPVPATPPYRLTGDLDYAEGRFRFTGIAGQVGNSDLEGAITVAPGAQRPEVRAELRSRSVDLADLAGFIGGEPGRQARPARERVLPDAPFNLPKLEMADVFLLYRAERIQRPDAVPLDELEARLELVGGDLRLHPLRFGVGRGRILVELALTPRPDGMVQAKAEVQFRQVDLARLMQVTVFEGAGGLAGAARIEGVGASFADLLARGQGGLTLIMAGGNLSALLVDLSGLRLANALLSALGLPERAAVECFVADAVLREGRLLSRALLLETERTITEGQGVVDLGRERLEIRLRTESKHLTIGAVPTPIVISGTLRAPRVAPDPSELIARGGIAGALAAIAPPLAALPMIQFGVGDDPRCESMVRRARGEQRPEGGGRR